MQQLRRHFRHSRDGDDDDNGDAAGEGGKAKARVGEKEKREAAAAAERPLENTMGLLPSHPPARSEPEPEVEAEERGTEWRRTAAQGGLIPSLP